MTLDLLDTPLRATWDLHGADGRPARFAAAVAEALSEGGVFFATLEKRPLAHPEIASILSTLADTGCRTLLVCNGDEEELRTLEGPLSIGALFLDAASFIRGGKLDFVRLGEVLERLRGRGFDPSLLLTPLRGTVGFLPDLLSFCRERGVGKFKLPNLGIDASFCHSRRDEFLSAEDLSTLKKSVGDDPRAFRRGIALEIHDLFLWEILFPGGEEGRSEYGGCQAGNSLAHVDAEGRLHPCSSWPSPLGSLVGSSLAELWQSPLRMAIRAEIAATPAGCAGCRDYPLCFGGCRGLSRTLRGNPDGRDPLCSGTRS
jgi:radical SAM protein with 4Fe4S-binding SPASM domain